MSPSAKKSKKSFLKQIQQTFEDLEQCEEVDLKESYRLPSKKIRVPLRQYPLQLNLQPDGRALHLYPETPLNAESITDKPQDYILFDPEHAYSEIAGFLRLIDGEKIVIGPKEKDRLSLLDIPAPAEPVLRITNREGELIFKNLTEKSGSCIAPLTSDKKVNRISNWRIDKLKRIRKIFGGPIKPLSKKNALELISSVNELMEKEAHRPKDTKNRPGGVVALPRKLTPILVGDLHAKSDNLLVILTSNNFLESLEDGSASLLILGDAVHREDKGHYEEMESSLLIMDLIFKLKLRFPEQVFYIRGNHDTFSKDIGKAGVPQGVLWGKAILDTRGKPYLKEMERFYELLPLLVYSKDFVACHAAPPVSETDLHWLINSRKDSKLQRELTCNRLRAPNRPGGYTRKDVKRLRKCLDVPADTPVVVGHTPLSLEDTIWEKVGDIDNHYIIYGSHDEWVGVLTRIGGKLRPLVYPVEPLIPLINALTD